MNKDYLTTMLEFNLDGTYTVTKSKTYTSKEEAYKAAGIIECSIQKPTLIHPSHKYVERV